MFEERFIQAAAGIFADGESDLDAMGTEDFGGPSGMFRIGVGAAEDHAGDPGVEDGFRAGGSASESAAGLERDVNRGAAKGFPAAGGDGIYQILAEF